MKLMTLLFSVFTSATLLASTQAVVFDFGGVMTNEPNRQVVVDFLRQSFQLSETEFEEANLQKKQALKEGLTDAEFWVAYASKGI